MNVLNVKETYLFILLVINGIITSFKDLCWSHLSEQLALICKLGFIHADKLVLWPEVVTLLDGTTHLGTSGLSIGFPEDILCLDARHVAAIAYRKR